MSTSTDSDADGQSSIPATQLPSSAGGSEYSPENESGSDNGENDITNQSDDGPQSDIDGDDIDDEDGGDSQVEVEFKSSKHSEIGDFRALLKVLEYNHRTSLSEHLVASARLRALDERRRRLQRHDIENGSGSIGTHNGQYSKRIVSQSWTAWPLASWQLPVDNTPVSRKEDLAHDFDYVRDKKAPESIDIVNNERPNDEHLEEEEFGYESYRLLTHKLFTPPFYSKPLISEISAAGIRSLTREWRAQTRRTGDPFKQGQSGDSEGEDISSIRYSNDEIEKSLLYPHLHANILQLVNGIMDAMIAMRSTQAPSLTRRKLHTMKWNDLLNVAALIGMPALDGAQSPRNWLSVIESVRAQCEELFQDGQIPKYRFLEQEPDRLRKDIEPGRRVAGKGASRNFRQHKGSGEIEESAEQDDFENEDLTSSSQSASRKRRKRRRRNHQLPESKQGRLHT
ncbi:hypothetical protein POJ06DRAFT_254479 [Lipomyces tetrasporus]|uniref:Uncharacterized protein n=1 Tax=Lipomyces tetrasporus TaxID=54092 RepID=A0AAD7QQZ9_9ASCO|nr:uncharacterized protein POJ06DRAFT_254479 [Lipomyces tetrasporus]KAJ8099785.1 hypothetical protein POJ06DRAFT_254479 [Lipomyces tetrasporus]